MGANKNAEREEIRALIRQGKKTSAIIAMDKWPTDLIKAVKSEEFENDKKLAKEKEIADQKAYLAKKREINRKRFLKKLGQDPDKVVANEIVNQDAPQDSGNPPNADEAQASGEQGT